MGRFYIEKTEKRKVKVSCETRYDSISTSVAKKLSCAGGRYAEKGLP